MLVGPTSFNMESMNMFNVKRNQIFNSNFSHNRIRARAVMENGHDERFDLVEIVNVNTAGKAIPGTTRTVYRDSIRRNYNYA